MVPFFADLVVRTDEARRAFETSPAVQDAVANGMSIDRYRKLLLELYHVVWHFNPVCAAAASRISDTHREVRYHLYEHMHEEMGHEEWVINDLEAMGVSRETAMLHEPETHTLTLNGYNYWSAERRHPCSALGMLYALEVIASVYGGPFVTALRDRLFIEGDRGVSFLGSHAELDKEHMAELREILNTIKDDEARHAVTESTMTNFHHFQRVIEAI